VPDADAQSSAASLLRDAFPRANHVDVRTEHAVTFVDAGANFETVSCPQCANELEQDWWGDAMDRAAESTFADLAVTLPCCGASSSLNDLRYEMPQGFARFVIDILNPGVADIPASLTARLCEVLHCKVRFVC